MNLIEGKELIHDRIGTRIIELSNLFGNHGVLKEYDGNDRDPPDINLKAGGTIVTPARTTVTVEDLAESVFGVGKAEYINAQKNLMNFPQLRIPEDDYYRFLSIFDKQEIDTKYRRYAALSPLAYYATINFDLVMPLIRKKIDDAFQTIALKENLHAISATEEALIRRYTTRGIR